MNKLVYLGLSILDVGKTVMYEFWCDYLKPKYGEYVKLGHMDTDSFIVYVKTDDTYKHIAEDAETRFDISNFEIDRVSPKEKNKKSDCTNERGIKWKNNEKICWFKSKNI